MSNDKLNILVLHALGDPRLARSFLVKHVFCLKKYFPSHNYIYHDVNLPLPDYAKEIEYDGIILDVTCLTYRWDNPETFSKIKSDYSFLSRMNSFKIALPQDEYDCHELLDEWVSELFVDVVYSVCTNDLDVLYPKFHKQGEIKLGYTGYIDSDNNFPESFIKRFDDREIDIGYRARRLPYYFGRLGLNKGAIADCLSSRAEQTDLNCDISVREEDTILGSKWYDFINNCKFTLGANSGSSLLDPRGNIQRNIKKYILDFPTATFEEVERLFFPGEDGQYIFTAISPRIFEAGLLKSGLVLVKGDYSGIIREWEHYIPLESDCSNFSEVHEALRDKSFASRMIENCYQTLMDTKELHYEHFTDEIIKLIRNGSKNKNFRSQGNINKVIERYNIEMPQKYEQLWAHKTQIRKYSTFLNKYPRLHHMSKNLYHFVRSRFNIS